MKNKKQSLDSKEPKEPNKIKIWFLAAFFVFAVIFVFSIFNQNSDVISENNRKQKTEEAVEISFSELMIQVEAGNVVSVAIKGGEVEGVFKSRQKESPKFKSSIPSGDMLAWAEKIRKMGIDVSWKPEKGGFASYLLGWLPFILIIGIWIFLINRAQGGVGTMKKISSVSKMAKAENAPVLFKDVAGVDEAKEELLEIVEFLKDPKRFGKLGAKVPKGVLLSGPHGTGKTLLAKAVAGEAQVPFFNQSGSDFVEMFVGVGASRIRNLFNNAKKEAPCIVFIDEIDAVGRHRGSGLGNSNDEREQTLNQILVQMDGFESNEGIIVLAATNRPDILDPALVRPGRFDRQVVVLKPDVLGREQILKVHVQKIITGADVNLGVIARGTPGFSGADLANLANEAALIAAKKNKNKVEMQDFELAKDKIIMGTARKMVMSKEEKKNTAYHEAGHTVVALKCENADPVHKVTIIPRGGALGVTMSLPEEDRLNYDFDYLFDQIVIFLGGRAAEEIFLSKKTAGTSNDIERANSIARDMVSKWGMSEKVGLVSCGQKSGQLFLGREIQERIESSEEILSKIDREIADIIDKAYRKALSILEENFEKTEKLAEELLKKETLCAEEIKKIIIG